jgi:probable HAF family extracellular repeat protein
MSKIRFRMVLAVMVTVVGLASVGYAQANKLKFTSIDFPGAVFTAGRGINNHGDIAGSYRMPGFPRQAMLLIKGKFIPLAPPAPDASFSEATSINDRGDVTGQWGDANGFFHGFLISDGVLTILNVPGATDTFALGVNDSGLVAGYWDLLDQNGNGLANLGFTWKDGAFIDTQINFPGATGALPGAGLFGVNSRGDLSGVWVPDLNGNIEHGFVCPKSAPCFSYDASVPGTVLTQGDGINAHGQVAGVSCDDNFVCHAFLLAGATLTSFDFPGAEGTLAYGINSAAQIVGRYSLPDGSTHGFLAERVRTGKPQ